MTSSTATRTFALCLAITTGCVPKIIRPISDPDADNFHPRLAEASICSMLTAGNEYDRVVSGVHDCGPTMSLEEAVALLRLMPSSEAIRPLAVHVRMQTAYGPIEGWLEVPAGASGLAVFFSGLGMYGDGPLAEDFALAAFQSGVASFRVERDASAQPYVMDPKLEALRAVDAAVYIIGALELPANVVYEGVSMGGWEALLAGRLDPSSSVVVRDPVLAPKAVARHLDHPGKNPVSHVMAQFFRRMAMERHGEDRRTTFREFMERSEQGMTDLVEDAPERWLCELPPEEQARFGVHLSVTDPALGRSNREGLEACDFPVVISPQAGHIPLACELDAPGEMTVEGLSRLPGANLADQTP